jgi:hypothetical protein
VEKATFEQVEEYVNGRIEEYDAQIEAIKTEWHGKIVALCGDRDPDEAYQEDQAVRDKVAEICPQCEDAQQAFHKAHQEASYVVLEEMGWTWQEACEEHDARNPDEGPTVATIGAALAKLLGIDPGDVSARVI